jgi:hypothetical protein
MDLVALLATIESALEAAKVELAKGQPGQPAPAAATPPPKIVVPVGFAFGWMSIFGLNWDGSDDQGDEQPDGTPMKGAWGDETHNKTVMGCALPIKTLQLTFGSTAKPSGYVVNVYSLVTQELKQAEILDKGPSVRVGKPIDGTYALHNSLGHLDYGIERYGSYGQFPAAFPVIYWIEDKHGLTKPVLGWDNIAGHVE